MVPGHPFNEMKPNSGRAAAEHSRSKRLKKSPRDRRETGSGSSSRRICFGIDEPREPFPYLARFVEMIGNALRASAYRKCEAAKIGHDGEHALVGNVVADTNRTAAFEGLVAHQFDDP